ncbi:unnamed protein product [Miscanthus lutarioriparius]|uniref:PUM-HD domain-containing protein n=1 Tax=Miscanthus lutarioriparius TaxID=422564 RepID=A0A811MBB2_9POAL|nr:unnamed protein product [Miscanthus lutarioriparius]
MDTTKHPASTDPAAAAADLNARFRKMRLVGDPSSPQPQPQPQPPLQPTTMRQLEVLAAPAQQYHHLQPQPQPPLPPITAADLLRKLELPAAPAQQYHHPQTRLQSYGMGESSTGAGAGQNYGMGESSTVVGYVPPYASSSIHASHFGKHSPRHNAAPAAPTAPKLPGANAGQLDPNPNPIAPPNPSVPCPRASSTLSASADLFQPAMPMEDPNLAAYWDDHESVFNPYAPAFQSTLFANPAGYGSWVPAAAPHWYPAPTLAQVRSRLLRRPMEPELLASPVASAHVARLLNDGDEQVRRSVLATFKRDVRCFMESSAQKQAVLLALVRACMWRDDELQDIVIAVYHTNGFLSGVVQHNHGLAALKELIRAAVLAHNQLLRPIVEWLLREPLFYKCPELLEHCFITMPYEYIKILIRFAIVHYAELLSSSSGSRCLSQCFVYARDKEVEPLERIILDYTAVLATGQYGNYFLQRVIECGGERLQVAIAERVAADVVSLSSDQFGSYVVESCFLQMRSLAPLQVVLTAFLALGDDDLAGLVRGGFSNYVVSKLLVVANNHMPAQARELARRIEKLPTAVHREMHARGVMAVVRKLIHRQEATRLY